MTLPHDPFNPPTNIKESRIFWTTAEEIAVCQAHITKFPGVFPTWRSIMIAQEVLPSERHKRSQPSPIVHERFRKFIMEQQGLPYVIEGCKKRGRPFGSGTRKLNGHTLEPQPQPEPAPTIELAPVLVDEKIPEPPQYDLHGRLVAINQLVFELQCMSLLDLKHCTKNAMEAGRLRNLLIQAENGLTYFEELFTKSI